MKKLILVSLICLSAFGCGTVTRYIYMSPVLHTNLNLTKNDIVIGDNVTATMPYDDTDLQIREKVTYKALDGTNYDFIVTPKYKIDVFSVGGPKITVTGRGAKIK